MKYLVLLVLFSSSIAGCGTVDVPSTTQGSNTATQTSTATQTQAQPAVVNNVTVNQNNGTTTPASQSAPESVAKGATMDEVEAVMGQPDSVAACNGDATGWWWNGGYCFGFTNGLADTQFNVPASKLNLSTWSAQ